MSFSKRLLSGAPAPFVNDKNFRAVIYTGDGSNSRTITCGFKPDWVVFKRRDGSDNWRQLDSSRGFGFVNYWNLTNAQDGSASPVYITASATGFSFTSNGYDNFNYNGYTYVVYCWKANGGTTSSNSDGSITSTLQTNSDAGFSIIKYTGNGSAGATIGHNLGVVPDMFIVKKLGSGTTNWRVYHKGIDSSSPQNYNLPLNGNAARYDRTEWNDTAPTSTVFSVNDHESVNENSTEYICYAFADKAGFSKFDSYAGNGSTTGPIVETGFEPAFLMVRRTDSGDNWIILDNARSTLNPRKNAVFPNLTQSELSSGYDVDFLSNGFQIKTSDNAMNNSGGNYIYMAFAANPDEEAPTLASSFNIETYTGTGGSRSITGLGFEPGFIWLKNRDQGGYAPRIFDILRGATKRLQSSTTAAESTDSTSVTSFDADGFSLGSDNYVNNSGDDFVAWTWKANDNEPTFIPEAGKKISLDHGASNYVALNAVSGSTGKYYFEVKFLSYTSANTLMVGLYTNGYAAGWQNTRSRSYYANSGKKYKGTTASNYGATFTTGDTIGVAVNGDDDEVTFYKNGTSQGLAFSGNEGDSSFGIQLSTGLYPCTAEIRFTSSEWQYSAPSGFTEWTAAKTAYDNGDITSSGGGFVYDNIESIVSVNSNAGFSIVEATAPSSGVFPVPHGLSSALDFYFIKRLDSTGGWIVYSRGTGANKYILLNDNAAAVTSTDFFDNTHATSTVFTLNAGQSIVGGAKFVAYCFHSVTGYQKFGTYTGSTSGVTITTGFKPDFILIKCTSNVEHWAILDTRRGNFKVIKPNQNDAESDSTLNTFTVSSTGFSFPHQDTADAMLNENGYEYLYWAAAKNVPSNTTLANSFKTVTYTGTGSAQSITGLGFKPDLTWFKDRDNVREHILSDSVRGIGREISSDTADAEETDRGVGSFDSDGFSFTDGNTNYNASSQNYVAWCWKAGNTWQSNVDGTIPSTVNVNTANGFSIVKYFGSGSSGSVGHGLSSTPDFITIKRLDSSTNWQTWYTGAGTDPSSGINRLYLNTNDDNDSSTTNVYYPDATKINLNSGDHFFNTANAEYIAYCWHSVSGYSKIGTYTGNGSTQSITGLGFQPDWLIIKQTNANNHWRIFDSARGLTSPQTLFSSLNSQEDSESNTVSSFDSDGFTMGSQQGVNDNGDTYLYMAFKAN